VVTTLVFATTAQAKIYKIVDEFGNVSYTDVAPTDAEQREKTAIELNINNTYTGGPLAPAATPTVVNPKATKAEETTTATAYKQLKISSPSVDSNIRSNNGDITLAASIEPQLQVGDSIRFFLDGKPVGTVSGTSLSLNNIDRGTHTVAAVVLDSAGKTKISSRTTSFSLSRFSQLNGP